MKWALYVVLALAVVGGWIFYAKSDSGLKEMERQIETIHNEGNEDDEDMLARMKSNLESKRNEKTFSGILLAFLTAGLVGIIFVIHVLPAIAQRMTHAVYDSAEMVEKDPMHDARAKVAQGDYEGAVEAFRLAAEADPLNRLPWVEIAKIQRDHLEDPAAAVQTLRQAVEEHDWQVNDAAYLMFRLAELYDEDMHDRQSAATIMQQVLDQFPETRHSANARHKLHEWGLA